MAISKESQAAARLQRLEDRNLNKERSESLTDDTGDNKYTYVGMPTNTLSTIKPATSRTVPDSFSPPVFSGTNADADTWLAHFQRYAEYRQLSDEDKIAHLSHCRLKVNAN